MEVRLHISRERLGELTWDDQIALQEMAGGEGSERQLRDLVARFVVGEDGSYLPERKARAALGKLKQAEALQVAEEFFKRLRELAVNPTSAAN